jgi:hypothetical protein
VVDFVLGAGVCGGLLGAALLCARQRRGWWFGLLLLTAAVIAGITQGWLPRGAPLEGAPLTQTAVLAGWLLLGAGARAVGIWLPGPLGAQAALAGLLIGDVGASALFLGAIQDRGRAIKAALLAGAMGLMSPVGTAVQLVSDVDVGLLPLALAAVVWPRGPGLSGTNKAATVGLAAVAVVAWFTPWVVVGTGLVLAVSRRTAPWRDLVWVLSIGGLVWVAASSGALHQTGLGVDYLVAALGPEIGPVVLATLVATVGLLVGENALALTLFGITESVHAFKYPAVETLVFAAAATGGVTAPLQALRYWWRQLLVLLIWTVLWWP